MKLKDRKFLEKYGIEIVKRCRWRADEKKELMTGVERHGYNFKAIAGDLKTRTAKQIRSKFEKIQNQERITPMRSRVHKKFEWQTEVEKQKFS